MARALHFLFDDGSVRRGRVLLAAAVALVVAGGPMVLGGCLTPPPIETEPQTEHAPVVDESQVLPPEKVIEMDLTQDPDQTFRVDFAASDADGDALNYYWYLLLDETETGVEPVTNSTSLFYRPCSPSTPRPLATPPPPYLFVEVDITDRPREKGPDGEELPEPRTYPDDANVVTLDWVIAIKGETCP